MTNIIPTPKIQKRTEGFFSLSGACAFVHRDTDKRVISALSGLCESISELTGVFVPISSSEAKGAAIRLSHGRCGEGYSLTVSEDGIDIYGGGPAGAFYAVQSLSQLVRQNKDLIPCCFIEDEPDFSYRGFYHDVTRGRVPTLKKLKEIADMLAAYKVNSLQLYVEDAFTFKELEGVVSAECALTPSEILELDSYCRDRFIDLVPSMSTFGHLYTLLQSDRYRHICELEDYRPRRHYWPEKQWHHTVDVYHPDTFKVISSMIEQYLPLFSSNYFNICCDETIDLCNGKNEGKDKCEAYFHHVEKLVQLVKSYGKTVMLWGDQCMAHPDEAKKRLPEDVIVLNWCYRRQVAEWIPKMFWERGFEQIACTGTSSWENFIENVNISVGNIESYAAHAKKFSARGILNTNWGDFGHVCAFGCNLYGLVFGAQKSWNVDAVTDGEFELCVSRLVYGVWDFNMAELLRSLGRACRTCNWSSFVLWYSDRVLEGKDTPPGYGGYESALGEQDAHEALEICYHAKEKLLAVGDEGVRADLLLAVQAIEIMNRSILYLNGAEGCDRKEELLRDIELWLSEYSASWLRDNKPSGLWRIRELISDIPNLKKAQTN